MKLNHLPELNMSRLHDRYKIRPAMVHIPGYFFPCVYKIMQKHILWCPKMWSRRRKGRKSQPYEAIYTSRV